MKLSVIICAYNESNYIDQSIRSVLLQTVEPSEILLVDGGSSDETPSICGQYAETYSKIRFVDIGNKVNIPKMRNIAIEAASGEFLTFLDGDDLFRENKIELEFETLRNNKDASIVFSDYAYIDKKGQIIDNWSGDNQIPTGNVLMENAGRMWPRGSLYRSSIISKKLLTEIGMFDENLSIYEDWDMKIRTAARSEVIYCDEILSEYRLHSDGISSRSSAREYNLAVQKIWEKNRSMLKKNLGNQAYENVEASIHSLLLKSRLLCAKEQRAFINMMRLYVEWLLQDPKNIFDIKSNLKFMLPTSIISVIEPIYMEVRRLVYKISNTF